MNVFELSEKNCRLVSRYEQGCEASGASLKGCLARSERPQAYAEEFKCWIGNCFGLGFGWAYDVFGLLLTAHPNFFKKNAIVLISGDNWVESANCRISFTTTVFSYKKKVLKNLLSKKTVSDN